MYGQFKIHKSLIAYAVCTPCPELFAKMKILHTITLQKPFQRVAIELWRVLAGGNTTHVNHTIYTIRLELRQEFILRLIRVSYGV